MDRKIASRRKFNIARIKEWTGLIKDIGVILGIPVLIVAGMKIYERQIDALKAENEAVKSQVELLKQTQYDKVWSIVDSQTKIFEKYSDIQKRVFEKERKSLIEQISTLESQDEQKLEEIQKLRNSLEIINDELGKLRNKKRVILHTSRDGVDDIQVIDFQPQYRVLEIFIKALQEQ